MEPTDSSEQDRAWSSVDLARTAKVEDRMRSIWTGFVSAAALVAVIGGCERDRPEPGETRREGTVETRGQPGTPAAERAGQPATAPAAEQPGQTAPAGMREQRELEIELKAADDKSDFEAEVKLVPVAEGVKLAIEVENAKPGMLRVVLHEKEDCSNVAGMSMGEPLTMSHAGMHPSGNETGTTGTDTTGRGVTGTGTTGTGTTGTGTESPAAGARGTTGTGAMPKSGDRPFGDLGTISVAQDGKGRLEIVVPGVSLDPGGGMMSLLGRSIVVHEGDKSGKQHKDFGRSLACGSIKRS
jgi:Cu/Zn superoxide dismutase